MKIIEPIKILLTACLLVATFNACQSNKESGEIQTPVVDSVPPALDTIDVPVDSIVMMLSKDVRSALKNKDYASFTDFFHPVTGVRFSPYGYIDTTTDLIFTKDEFLKDINTDKKFTWGSFDGSGDPIQLNIKSYIDKFVYNVDFLNPEKDSVNVFIGYGNSLNNLSKIYPGLPFTESYFSGFKKEYEGMDWTTLRLVFKAYQNKYYLVGLVHDQWTI